MGSSSSKPVNSRKRAGQPFEIVVEIPARPSSSASSRQRKSPSNKSEDADITMSPTKKQKIAPASPLLGFPVSPTRKSRSSTPFQQAPDSIDSRVVHATNSLENLTTYTPSQNDKRMRAKSRDRSVSPTPSFEVPMPSGQAYTLQDIPSSSQLTSLSQQQASSPILRDIQDVEMASDSDQEADMTLDNIGEDHISDMPHSSQQLKGLNGKLVTVTSKPKALSGSRVGTAPRRSVGRPKKSPVRSSPVGVGMRREANQSPEVEGEPVSSTSATETSTRRNIDAFMKTRGVTPASSAAVGDAKPKDKTKVAKPRKSAPQSQEVDAAAIISNYGERSKRRTQPIVKYASDASSSELEEAEVQRPKKVKNGKGKARAREESEDQEGEQQLTDAIASGMSEDEASNAKQKPQPKKRPSLAPKAQARSKSKEKKKRESESTASDTGDLVSVEASEPEGDTDNDSDDFSLKPTYSKKPKAAAAPRKDSKLKPGRPSKPKPPSPAPAKKLPTLSRKPLQRQTQSESEEDETLPSLLPTSSFIKVPQPKWDLQLLDEAVFVALPGIPKNYEEGENTPSAPDISADAPRFWWPARILSRNRQNFRVLVVLDPQKEEILKYTSLETVIPQEQLVESGIVNLKDSITDEIRFPDIATAIETFRKHDMASAYTHPSESAFKVAVRKGRQVPEDDSSLSDEEGKSSPKKRKVQKKRKSKAPIKRGNESSENEEGDSFNRRLVAGMYSSQTQVETVSEDEELDIEIEVGTCGLGRSDLKKPTEEWWPAKVVAIRSMEEVQTLFSQKSSSQVRKGSRKTTKNGPYQVEFYPGESGRDPVFWLWREHILLSTDADFKRVPLGPMEERKLKDDDITPEDFESIREPLQRLLKGQYRPGAHRVNLFFGNKEDRGQLAGLARYGDFPPAHIRQTSDYIKRMLDTPDIDMDPRIVRCTQEQRIALIASVLLLVALELLVIHNGDIEEEAIKQLEDEGLPTHRESLEMKEHQLAAEVLDDKKDWYKKVLNLRDVSSGNASMGEGFKIDKKVLLGYEDMGSRTKIRKNYKE